MTSELTRRDFLSALGGGVVVLCMVEAADAQESGRRARRGDAQPQEISAWLHIGEDGVVTVCTGKTEVGQNIRTSLSQAVAQVNLTAQNTFLLLTASSFYTYGRSA